MKKQILIIIQQPELVGLVHCVTSVIYVSPIYTYKYLCVCIIMTYILKQTAITHLVPHFPIIS